MTAGGVCAGIRPEVVTSFQQKRFRLWIILMTFSICFDLVHPLNKNCPRMNLATGEIVLPNVPSKRPRLYFGSYESVTVTWPDHRTTRDVFVYWRNVDEPGKCSDVGSSEYSAFYLTETRRGRKTAVRSNFTYANHAAFVGLQTDAAYNIVVYATNAGGPSPDASAIYVPRAEDLAKPGVPIELTKTRVRAGVYELSWTNGDHRTDWPNHYSLYWCENEAHAPNQCNGNMDSIMVPTSRFRFNVTVPDAARDYQFAISANSRHVLINDPHNGNQFTSVSGGMVWESCEMRRNTLNGVGVVRNVWVSVVGPTYMGLRWKVDCVDRSGALKSYQVFYCPVHSVHRPVCADHTSQMVRYGKVIRNRIPLIFLENLMPSTTYMISIEILTNIENWYKISLRTDPLFHTTKAVDDLKEKK